uniref:Uncharacterized protein n=1 Tax=Panagrolaimus davidi TaxID=227884 RepID=A0A914Q4H1_9BILA
MINDFFKPELFRATAKRVKEMIGECIEKGSNEFQLFDSKGERKYNFAMDEIGVHFSKNFNRCYPPYLNKFDIIYNIYKAADEIYSGKSETYGFYAPNIYVTKVLLISSNQLSEYSHRYGIPSSTLVSFIKWFNACIGTNLTVDGDDSCKTTKTVQKTPIIVKENESTKIEKYFSVTFNNLEASYPTTSEDHEQNDDDDKFEFNYFQNDIKRSVSSLVEEDNDKHMKCPIPAQHDIVNGVKIYPVGIIPPYFVSPRRGVWILPGMEANILEPPYSSRM